MLKQSFEADGVVAVLPVEGPVALVGQLGEVDLVEEVVLRPRNLDGEDGDLDGLAEGLRRGEAVQLKFEGELRGVQLVLAGNVELDFDDLEPRILRS